MLTERPANTYCLLPERPEICQKEYNKRYQMSKEKQSIAVVRRLLVQNVDNGYHCT